MSTGIPTNIGEVAGPLLLGYTFNWALFGALAVQFYTYVTSFPNDRRLLKCLVFGIFTLEMTQTLLVARDMFDVFASGWGRGDLSQLQSVHLTWLSAPIIDGIVSCVVQLLYAYRLYILSHSKMLFGIIATLSITQTTSSIVAGVQSTMVDSFAKLQSATHVATTIWLVGSTICDITIAACISYYLSRKNTAAKEIQMLVKRLVRQTIETGALTAIVATVDVVIFLALPNTNYHLTPTFIIAKLYSNSLFMVLNARSGTASCGSQSTLLFAQDQNQRLTSSQLLSMPSPNTLEV